MTIKKADSIAEAMIKARIYATNLSQQATAAYWVASYDDDAKRYHLQNMCDEFALLKAMMESIRADLKAAQKAEDAA